MTVESSEVHQAISTIDDPAFRSAFMALVDRQDRMHAENQRPSGWVFDKTISITNLLTMLSAIIAVAITLATFNTRVSVIEDRQSTRIAAQTQTDIRQDQEAMRFQARIEKGIDDVNVKLDRLGERIK